MFYWILKTVVLGPVLRVLFRPWVDGAEHVPDEGPAIFASNHLSFSDSIFLPLMVPRRVTFLAKSDYFTGRGIKGRLTAAFFRGVGQVPIDRSGQGAGEAALRSGLRILGQDDLLGIYPEGTRSPDGRLYKGRTGVARLALTSGAPVIPVAMINTDKAQPTGQKIPTITRVGMRLGAPMDFARYRGMEDDRFVLRTVTDEIMDEIQRMSGQEYVDIYASTMKERIAKAVAAARVRASQIPTQVTETREQLQESLQEQISNLQDQITQLQEQLPDRLQEQIPDRLQERLAHGGASARAARESGAGTGEPPETADPAAPGQSTSSDPSSPSVRAAG